VSVSAFRKSSSLGLVAGGVGAFSESPLCFERDSSALRVSKLDRSGFSKDAAKGQLRLIWLRNCSGRFTQLELGERILVKSWWIRVVLADVKVEQVKYPFSKFYGPTL
jgi:hypothetical protein